jgi:hypothetical protein
MSSATKTLYHPRPKSRWLPCTVRREVAGGVEIVVDGKFRFVSRDSIKEVRR